MNLYNEIDPYAVQWLRNLIAAGHLAPGVVDTRPIQEIEAWELLGYTQCHFFCGIGIWPLALRNAGWSDAEPIWTGSCPCQPFSQAGKQKGFSDDRHLWPYWFNLIAQCRPPRVIGEQVASALDWLDLVQTDMEAANYAFGAADLCAAGFGGAHIRQRLYFVGLADASPEFDNRSGFSGPRGRVEYSDGRAVGGLADPVCSGQPGSRAYRHACDYPPGGDREINRAFDDGKRGAVSRVEHTNLPGQYGGPPSREQPLCFIGDRRNENAAICYPRQTRSLDDADWLLCRNPAGEPSWRPVEPGTFPLAHGVASRMGKLRAYGNALDAETATIFCETVAEIVGIRPVTQEYDL